MFPQNQRRNEGLRPAGTTPPDAEGRNTTAHLKLACPQCGARGTAAMGDLDHFFLCRRCDQWYRVERSSFVAVEKPPTVLKLEVRTGFSEWHGDRYRLPIPRTVARVCAQWFRGSKYRPWVAGVSLALLGCVLIVMLRSPAPAADAALPNVLEERVPLWINAWFAQDMPRLLRLTAPSHDRQLRRWVSYNPPPNSYDVGELLKSEVRLTAVQPRENQAVEVTAEVIIAGRGGLQKRLLVHQTWHNAAGTWYFVPPVERYRPNQRVALCPAAADKGALDNNNKA